MRIENGQYLSAIVKHITTETKPAPPNDFWSLCFDNIYTLVHRTDFYYHNKLLTLSGDFETFRNELLEYRKPVVRTEYIDPSQVNHKFLELSVLWSNPHTASMQPKEDLICLIKPYIMTAPPLDNANYVQELILESPGFQRVDYDEYYRLYQESTASYRK